MIDRKKIKKCPLCGSEAIEHIPGDHVSKLRGTAHHVPQSICHNCGEIFLGPDSLEVIRSQEGKSKIVGKKRRKDTRQEYHYR
jgi:YgiT-type zinc finger domain-containing protein